MPETPLFLRVLRVSPAFSMITQLCQTDYKAVKINRKKLQIALANDKIKWYIIYKPVEAHFCMPGNGWENRL